MAKQIFDSLAGIWRLVRHTTTPLEHWQNAGAECIRATGVAAFILSDEDPNMLIYSEKVFIQNPNDATSPMSGVEAKQKYKYRYDDRASSITKYFFDDRLFYKMNFDQNQSEQSSEAITACGRSSSELTTACGEHLCIQDLYLANYTFKNDNSFVLKYKINGPKKCYEITNEYEKFSFDEINKLGIHIENGQIL